MKPFNNQDHPRDFIGAIITGIVTFAAYFTHHLINVSSRHIAVALDVPIYNTSIYFSKLYSSRCLSMTIGSILHYTIAVHLRVDLKTTSFVSLISLLLVRLCLAITSTGEHVVSLYVYKLLNWEALCFGFFQVSLFKIVTRYHTWRAISIDLCRFTVFLIQAVMDVFYKNTLLMISIQCWFIFNLTVVAVICWFYYLYYSKQAVPGIHTLDTLIAPSWEVLERPPSKFECEHFKKYDYRTVEVIHSSPRCRFAEYSRGNISLFLMFTLSLFFKDFLYPGVLPYAILDRDKGHSINLTLPAVSLIAPVLIFLVASRYTELWRRWDWYKDLFWLFIIPQAFCFGFSLYSIHTRVPLFRQFSEPRPTVFPITVILILSFSFVETLARQYYQMTSKNDTESLIMYHNIVSTFLGFLFSKLSVGYNCARVDYEYCLTPFYPTYKMSLLSSVLFWVGDVFRRAYEDFCGDFRLNIREYI